jgi:prohead serine protease
MNLHVRRYVEISKVETQEDGTLKVYGIASTGAVDSEGERISPEAMRAALPDYMKFGAVRDMHQPNAVGTAIQAEVDGEGKTLFAAHVVDPLAVKKVETKVFKGFSVGGKVTSRDEADKKLITGIRLIEVSLVDRPANPEAVFTMYKAETETPVEDEPVPVKDPPAEPTAAENAAKVAKEDREAIEAIGIILNKRELSPAELLAAARGALEKAKPRTKIIPAKFKKGMGALSMFADLLQHIGWLAQDAESEAEWEGDNSPLPANLRDWLADGIECFEAMSAEETAELLAALKAPVEVIESAADGADLLKLSAKHKEDLANLRKCVDDAHDHAEKCFGTLKDACAKMDNMAPANDGKDKEDDDMAAAAKPGDALKAALSAPIVAAVPDLVEVVAKATAPLTSIVEQLMKRLKAIEDQPAPAKGVLHAAAITVSKTADSVASDAAAVSPIRLPDGSIDGPATLVKMLHRDGPKNLGPA